MSSASSYAYRVQEEALRRERERRAAEDALRAAERRYAELRSEAMAARASWGDGVEIPAAVPVERSSELAVMVAARRELERLTGDGSGRLASQVSAARIALMRGALADLGGARDAEAAPRMATDVVGLDRPPAVESGPVAAEVDIVVERLLSRLDPAVESQVFKRLQTAAARARLATSSSARDRALDALRVEVQRTNADIEARRAAAERFDELEHRLDGSRGPEAAAARRLLEDARRHPSDQRFHQLEATVETALRAEEKSAPVRFATETIERVFREHGYVVGTRPDTFVGGEGLLAQHSDWQGYGVEATLAGDPRRLHLELVRGDADRVDQATRDTEVERQFCSRQDDLVADLAAAGIDIREIHRTAPGERRVIARPGLTESPSRGQAARRRAQSS